MTEIAPNDPLRYEHESITREIDIRFGVKIPLRDGVRLKGTHYSSKSQTKPSPCVVTITPYGADNAHEWGVYLATRGLSCLLVDCRGRGNSQGEFQPLSQEVKDGYDVVEWAASQPFCNGKVGMRGSSYEGYVQWATAKENPPHLATFVPSVAVGPGIDFPMRNNIFHPYVVQWLMLTQGHAPQLQMFRDNRLWSDFYAAWHRSGRAFVELDTFAGGPSPIFQHWLAHPQYDDYWERHCLSPDENARLQVPILTITASYDDDQPGALWHYREHLRSAPVEAATQHYLVIGPWDHRSAGKPTEEFGGIKIAKEGILDMYELHWQWFAWTMLEGSKPDFLKKQVAYYVTGVESWRYADSLEAVTRHHVPYYLGSNGRADDVFQAGVLELQACQGSPDSYRYDPRECDGAEVEAEARANGGSLVDQALTFALSGRQVIYHSAPLEQDTDICGFFRLEAWLAIDCPDTDFYVSVHEIAPDGSSLRLSTDALRARYRKDLRTLRLIETREPLRYRFERFTFIARRVKRGHRLRLIIAPLGRIIEGTFVQKNYNGGGAVAQESWRDGRPVTVTLFHDEYHPSALYVPIGANDPPSMPALSADSEEPKP